MTLGKTVVTTAITIAAVVAIVFGLAIHDLRARKSNLEP